MSIIKKPIVTEKMTDQGEELGKYAFEVDRKVNKIQIKEAVEQTYGVVVESVNTMIHPGKSKSRYTKKGMIEGSTGATKKAVVTLKSGDEIDFYSDI